ncbi:MAG: hypothetical protein EOM01_11380 [Spirochaetia bacterium]|nr:hypothetical protein [Spirochaetia bacterium]
MRKYKIYPQELKEEIISRFRQSGLSQTKFCNLDEVPITNSTLSEWLRNAGFDKFGLPFPKRQEPAQPALNMVCYNVGGDSRRRSNGGDPQQPSLAQMVAFHQEIQDICIELYRLACSKESITLLRRIKEVL